MLFDDDYELDSESEEEDEADEDSNGTSYLSLYKKIILNYYLYITSAEDFYGNDYPDDEESSEDSDGSGE